MSCRILVQSITTKRTTSFENDTQQQKLNTKTTDHGIQKEGRISNEMEHVGDDTNRQKHHTQQKQPQHPN